MQYLVKEAIVIVACVSRVFHSTHMDRFVKFQHACVRGL